MRLVLDFLHFTGLLILYCETGGTVRVFKNDARLRKPFHCCSAFPLQTQLGRHKHHSGRSVSEAALRFGNLCVYEPSTLQKKPSADSRKKPSDLRKKPSSLWRRCAANTFQVFQIAASIFKDAYRKNSLGTRLDHTIVIVNDGDLCYSPHPHHHARHLGWWDLWNKADLWCGEVFREGEDEWEVYLRRGGTVMV